MEIPFLNKLKKTKPEPKMKINLMPNTPLNRELAEKVKGKKENGRKGSGPHVPSKEIEEIITQEETETLEDLIKKKEDLEIIITEYAREKEALLKELEEIKDEEPITQAEIDALLSAEVTEKLDEAEVLETKPDVSSMAGNEAKAEIKTVGKEQETEMEEQVERLEKELEGETNELPEDVRNFIIEELRELEKIYEDQKEDKDTLEACKTLIELLKSDPIFFWTEIKTGLQEKETQKIINALKAANYKTWEYNL